MKKKMVVCLACSLLGLPSCVTTQVARLNPETAELPVYITRLPEQPYRELSYIEAAGGVFHTKQQLLNKLKERARKENADALIKVEFRYAGWLPYAHGVAIKLGSESSSAK